MKKYVLLIGLSLLLCGCGAEETFEMISDELVAPVMAQPRQITVELPEDAVLPVLESDTEQVYFCEDYELVMQTLSSGDLDATIQTISGYSKDQITVMHTQQGNISRYEFVWAAVGEQGERLGRGVVLDDGNYHYCISILRDAENPSQSQIVWDEVFRSFVLI